MNKTVKFRIVIFTLLIWWMAIIFMFSAQKEKESSKMSSGFVSAVISTVYPKYDEFSSQKQTQITDTITYIVRKTAHFSEYFILGALAFLAVLTFKKYKFKFRVMAAFGFCVLYSVSDELHQYFVQGRACRFTDVLIDSSGSLLAILLLIFTVLKISKFRNKLGE